MTPSGGSRKLLRKGLAILLSLAGAVSAQESLTDLALFREGCRALADERFGTAAQRFQECWELLAQEPVKGPESTFVASRLLESLVRDGAHRKAVAWIDRNPEFPRSPLTHHWMAAALQAQGRWAEAADHFRTYLAAVGDADPPATLNHAICLFRSGQTEAAYETVREKVPPSTPEIALRRAQIAAKASPETALEWIGKIDPAGSDWKTVRLPLARLHAALLEQTKNRKAGIDLVCGLVDSAATPQEARQALLLLEVFLDGRVPADLEPRLAAWSQDDQFPAHEAAALHRILLFKPAADQPAALRDFAASATDPELKAEAALRLGEAPSATPTVSDLAERTRFETARRAFREKRFDEAMRQSIQNAEANDGEETVRDLFNAAVSALLANDSEAFKRLEAEVATLSPQSTALVDLDYLGSLYFAAKGEPSAFERLNSFVLEHPKHPANIDARLALAEINLNQAPPRPNAARGILEGLATRPLTLVQNERLDYLTVWIEVTDQNSTELVKQADAFAANWPNSEYLPEILMLLASEHFKRRNLPAAAAIFDRIATTFPDSPLADTARFFEAKSSPATPGTIDKWRAIADGDSPLAAEAAHEMGLLLISLDQFEEARQTLTALLERLPADSPLRFATIADLGYASYLEALDNGKDRAKLEEAANRFAELSSPTSVPAKWRYNAAVRRGRCLEAMGKASVALEIYRSIVDETATSSPGAEETEWIFRAGFAAIDILNGQDDRGTAIAVADALSGQSGPRAIDAARLAERLRLKHWIWD